MYVYTNALKYLLHLYLHRYRMYETIYAVHMVDKRKMKIDCFQHSYPILTMANQEKVSLFQPKTCSPKGFLGLEIPF